jgi:FkbM family methyltransferase
MTSLSRAGKQKVAPLDVLAAHIARSPGSPRVILDVGAADGQDTLRYAMRFPSAQVFAFEPLSFNVEELRRKVDSRGLRDRIRIFQLALSDRDGDVDFWVSGGTPPEVWAKQLASPPGPTGWRYSSSMLEPLEHLKHWPWCTFERETVPARRLDALAGEEGIDRIDFAHLDVQGAELTVLRGAGALLGQIGGVWLEVSNAEMYRGQPLRAEVESFMSQHGFQLAFDAGGGKRQGDQLWVRG